MSTASNEKHQMNNVGKPGDSTSKVDQVGQRWPAKIKQNNKQVTMKMARQRLMWWC
jgi:hypothetical protein